MSGRDSQPTAFSSNLETLLEEFAEAVRHCHVHGQKAGHANDLLYQRRRQAILDYDWSLRAAAMEAAAGDPEITAGLKGAVETPADWRQLLQDCVDGWRKGDDIVGPMHRAESALKTARESSLERSADLACELARYFHSEPPGQLSRNSDLFRLLCEVLPDNEQIRADHFHCACGKPKMAAEAVCLACSAGTRTKES